MYNSLMGDLAALDFWSSSYPFLSPGVGVSCQHSYPCSELHIVDQGTAEHWPAQRAEVQRPTSLKEEDVTIKRRIIDFRRGRAPGVPSRAQGRA
jgi:hypothetical protein